MQLLRLALARALANKKNAQNIEKAKQEIERLEKEDAVSEPNGEKTVATLENCVVDMSLEENAKYAES